MEAVRKIVDGNALSQIVALPPFFQNRKVELIIKPIAQNQYPQLSNRNQLRALLHGSDTEALSGVITADSDFDLDALREERRAKYERLD